MKLWDTTIEDSFYINYTPSLIEAAECIKQILDAKYEPANLEEITSHCTHLTDEQREDLLFLLKNMNPYSMELLELGKEKTMI
jgi:hypothetical protein